MVEPNINIIAILVAAAVPLALGVIYYGLVFSNTWKKAVYSASLKDNAPSPVSTYGVAILVSLILAFFLNFEIQFIHKDVNQAGELFINSHFSFKHGALHGAIVALTIIMPVIVSIALLQKTPWKASLLHVVFWIMCLAIMGGILDVWQ